MLVLSFDRIHGVQPAWVVRERLRVNGPADYPGRRAMQLAVKLCALLIQMDVLEEQQVRAAIRGDEYGDRDADDRESSLPVPRSKRSNTASGTLELERDLLGLMEERFPTGRAPDTTEVARVAVLYALGWVPGLLVNVFALRRALRVRNDSPAAHSTALVLGAMLVIGASLPFILVGLIVIGLGA